MIMVYLLVYFNLISMLAIVSYYKMKSFHGECMKSNSLKCIFSF